MKTIHIRECSCCPYFTEFPADYYDGDCTHNKALLKTRDTRISNKDTIPDWCPL
jgi:hypothetical protein